MALDKPQWLKGPIPPEGLAYVEGLEADTLAEAQMELLGTTIDQPEPDDDLTDPPEEVVGWVLIENEPD